MDRCAAVRRALLLCASLSALFFCANVYGQTAPSPTCSLSVSFFTPQRGDTITASGSCSTGSTGLASISLDFGYGTPPTTKEVSCAQSDNFTGDHVYQRSGNFTITVPATDLSGASGSASQVTTVNDQPVCTFSVD